MSAMPGRTRCPSLSLLLQNCSTSPAGLFQLNGCFQVTTSKDNGDGN